MMEKDKIYKEALEYEQIKVRHDELILEIKDLKIEIE